MQTLARTTIALKESFERGFEGGGFPSGYFGRLAALFQRNVMPRVVAKINLARTGYFLFRIEEHLFPLRDPARSARNRKQHGEQGHRESHGLINQAGVEVHVGVKLALDEILIFQGDE